MLLEVAVDFEKIQVVSPQGQPPSHTIFPMIRCPCCGSMLHGHGWRQRYLIDCEYQVHRIWIHRKLCPNCCMSYTLLPTWVHAFKCFSVELIRAVLSRALETGHLGNHFQVSRSLQRQWKRQFIIQASTQTNLSGQQLLESLSTWGYGSCLTAPAVLRVLTCRLKGKMHALTHMSKSHQRLFLFIPQALG
jgi:hypothetical protein